MIDHAFSLHAIFSSIYAAISGARRRIAHTRHAGHIAQKAARHSVGQTPDTIAFDERDATDLPLRDGRHVPSRLADAA